MTVLTGGVMTPSVGVAELLRILACWMLVATLVAVAMFIVTDAGAAAYPPAWLFASAGGLAQFMARRRMLARGAGDDASTGLVLRLWSAAWLIAPLPSLVL